MTQRNKGAEGNANLSKQQQGNPGRGSPKQQQQGPATQQNPGAGEPEVQEDVGSRSIPDEQASRRPQVDVERE
jgi:hypothetical protein